MDVVALPLVVALLAGVVWLVSAPLRGGAEVTAERRSGEIADLEDAKAAKYAEIRDAEMDFRTGKLSEADWRDLDRTLRAEAIDILRRLDAAGADGPERG